MCEEVEGQRSGRKKKDPNPNGPMRYSVIAFISLPNASLVRVFDSDREWHRSDWIVLLDASERSVFWIGWKSSCRQLQICQRAQQSLSRCDSGKDEGHPANKRRHLVRAHWRVRRDRTIKGSRRSAAVKKPLLILPVSMLLSNSTAIANSALHRESGSSPLPALLVVSAIRNNRYFHIVG